MTKLSARVLGRRDYFQIAKLRRDVAIDDGRIPGGALPSTLVDQHDAHSVQVGVFDSDTLVGVGRVTLNFGLAERSELADHGAVPDSAWQQGFAEIGRFAVARAHRGSGTFEMLVRTCAAIVAHQGLALCLVDCREFLVPVYRRLGARHTGRTIAHPLYPNEPMHVLVFETWRTLLGEGCHPLYWGRVVGPALSEHPEIFALIPRRRLLASAARRRLAASALALLEVFHGFLPHRPARTRLDARRAPVPRRARAG